MTDTLPHDRLPDRFYPIFDGADWLARALLLGVAFVQLRDKTRQGEALRAEIVRARDLAKTHGATLVVNDHWREAIDTGCDFVHLGQEDLAEADLPAIRRANIRLGISTHDDDELETALGVDPAYVALGPVYHTRLKAMRFAPQGLKRVTEWKARVGARPLVAIGGLSVERAPDVLAAGADCLSVVTDITLADDPEARIRQWIGATRPPPRRAP